MTNGRDPVTLEQAEEAEVDPPKPDKMAGSEADLFAHRENMQKDRLGWVGRFWGDRSEKPGNISAIIAIVLSAYLGILVFGFSQLGAFGDIFGGLTSIITLILGYLFGSGDRSN